MALIGTLVTAFRADTKGLEQGTKRAKGILGDFARSGDLGKITTLLRGGGALGILSVVTQGLKGINEALREMEQTGESGIRVITGKMAASIPVVGGLAEQISELRGRWIEMAGLPDVFGDKALLDATRGEAEMQKINAALRQQRKEWEATEKATQRVLGTIEQLARRMEVAFASPAGKAGMGIMAGMQDAIRQMQESGARPDVIARGVAQARATAAAEYKVLQDSLRRDQEERTAADFQEKQQRAAADFAKMREDNLKRIAELEKDIADRQREANKWAKDTAIESGQFKRDLLGLDTQAKDPGSFRQLNLKNVDIRGLQAGDPLVKLNEQANKYLKEMVDDMENMGAIIQA